MRVLVRVHVAYVCACVHCQQHAGLECVSRCSRGCADGPGGLTKAPCTVADEAAQQLLLSFIAVTPRHATVRPVHDAFSWGR